MQQAGTYTMIATLAMANIFQIARVFQTNPSLQRSNDPHTTGQFGSFHANCKKGQI